jgi:type II restriction enzyme
VSALGQRLGKVDSPAPASCSEVSEYNMDAERFGLNLPVMYSAIGLNYYIGKLLRRMNLQCRTELASAYKAGGQIARILSEEWCAREVYCPACDSDRLSPSRPNTPAIDFTCPKCEQVFQLKSLRSWKLRKIVDAGYEAMLRAIRGDKTPNLLLLQYSTDWLVNNLTLIPRFFFSESVIEKRNPLGPQARRAGWIGCNILLSQIPIDGKIPMVSQGVTIPVQRVRAQFSDLQKLGQLPPPLRGWTTDVLTLVRRLGKPHFSLGELYEFELELKALHPDNRNIRPKIRQQLQMLRDMGFIHFTAPGNYTLRK